jgi:hypothetical protein
MRIFDCFYHNNKAIAAICAPIACITGGILSCYDSGNAHANKIMTAVNFPLFLLSLGGLALSGIMSINKGQCEQPKPSNPGLV